MKIKSRVTGKEYFTQDCIYMTNHVQCQRFLQYFGSADYLVDILWDSSKKENALVYVWLKNPETAKAKKLWDSHLL